MKPKTYTLSSKFSVEETIVRLQDLFTKAGVQYRVEGLSIVSTKTPFPLGAFNRFYYSRRNWVGLNPFTQISGVVVQCRPGKADPTEVVVQVDRFRTFMTFAWWVTASGMAASGMPKIEYAILFIAVSDVAIWFAEVSFLAGYLLKKEIADCLKV